MSDLVLEAKSENANQIPIAVLEAAISPKFFAFLFNSFSFFFSDTF